MRRSELEHLIRAASAITDQYEIMVVGSRCRVDKRSASTISIEKSVDALRLSTLRTACAQIS